MKSSLRTFFATLAIMLACTTLSAQFMPNLGDTKGRDKSIPTTITSESMDIDMKNNLITLLGNVYLDDQSATIQCNKMVIYLADKSATDDKKAEKDTKKTQKKATETTTDEKGNLQIAGDKMPTKVECFEDVVITKKKSANASGDKKKANAIVKKDTDDTMEEESAGEEKATANKAVYDLVKNVITLTENPVIYRGTSTITGSKITFLINEDRMIVLRGKATTKEGLDQLQKDDSKQNNGAGK